MTAASNEMAPMPTIKTVTAIGSYSSQRNNIGKTLLSLLIFPDPARDLFVGFSRE